MRQGQRRKDAETARVIGHQLLAILVQLARNANGGLHPERHGQGRYAYFAPVWEELNRRKVTVYTHPTDAYCCVNLVQGVPPSALEWGTDTTRSIINLIFSGTSQKYKDINWIWSHGGGALSSVAERLLVQMVSTPPYKSKFTREQVQAELNRFYYDMPLRAFSPYGFIWLPGPPPNGCSPPFVSMQK